jgi:hypothetical protein
LFQKNEDVKYNHNTNHDQKIYPKHKKKKSKDHTKRSRKNTIKRNKNFVEEYKHNHPCICGESNSCCLSFHHKNGDKKGNISDMVNRAYSIKRIQAEIDKCIVLCLNCHTKLHNGEGDLD